MLFNDRVLFLHVPKTAGTSLTSFLLRELPGRIVLTDPSDKPDPSVKLSAAARAKLALRRLRRRVGMLARPNVKVVEGVRHETLAQARETLARFGRTLADFDAILAVIRNPYDLEVSRYHFFRRGYQGVRGAAHEHAEELAQAGDFESFARDAAYHGRLPSHIEDWYEIDGAPPSNLRLLRFEDLASDMRVALDGYCKMSGTLPVLNASQHAHYRTYLTREAEEAIYCKYRWLFDQGFYSRETVA